jgi:hypothetical protein
MFLLVMALQPARAYHPLVLGIVLGIGKLVTVQAR